MESVPFPESTTIHHFLSSSVCAQWTATSFSSDGRVISRKGLIDVVSGEITLSFEKDAGIAGIPIALSPDNHLVAVLKTLGESIKVVPLEIGVEEMSTGIPFGNSGIQLLGSKSMYLPYGRFRSNDHRRMPFIEAEFFPDGTRLLSITGDGTVRLWRTDKTVPSIVLMESRRILDKDLSADGRVVVCLTGDNEVEVFDAGPEFGSKK